MHLELGSEAAWPGLRCSGKLDFIIILKMQKDLSPDHGSSLMDYF